MNPTYPNTISGKYLIAVIVIGGVAYTIQGVMDWTATDKTAELDAMTGQTGGFEASDFGATVVEVAFDLIQNLLNGPYLTIQRGQQIYLRLFRSGGDLAPAFDIPNFNIFQSVTKGAVKDRFTVAVSGKSSGPYTANNPGAA